MLKQLLIILCIYSVNWAASNAQELAFPTAEGFGRHVTGGRGGTVYIVTNLNDDGPGSLRKGIQQKEVRTIVFEMGGTITLKSTLDINHGNLTIAGQTAPGEGITIKSYPVKVKASNVIIRYMRFRMGDEQGVEDDALGGRGQENIMIDHCSISWATDENVSFYWNKNFSMQWCIISEALNRSVHHKGAHGYGGIWGGEQASFHHNLIVSNTSRNPRFSGSESVPNSENELVDFRNNVIANWGQNSIYGGEKGSYNVVNNYFKPGPATASSKRERILNPYQPYGRFYVNGNYVEGAPEVNKNNWNGGIQCEHPEKVKSAKAFSVNNIITASAGDVFDTVLRQAGASHKRDAVDKRIVQEVTSGNYIFRDGIIDSQEEVGSWPVLKQGTAKTDSDRDGIPDDWEKRNGLNGAANDANGYDLDENYTNLEVYCNQILK